MAGASAGGFAALLFGSWCGADEVIAFSPQTFVDAENRRLAGDVALAGADRCPARGDGGSFRHA